MLKFYCHRCSETFRVEIHNLGSKTNLFCQNCGSELPRDAVSLLNEMGEKFKDTVDVLKRTGAYQNCWSVSFESSHPLPPEVTEYEHLVFGHEDEKRRSFWDDRNKN